MYKMIRICCVCKSIMGTIDTDTAEDHGKLSHGMCEKCSIVYCQENDSNYEQIKNERN
jgi:hypothetical protein